MNPVYPSLEFSLPKRWCFATDSVDLNCEDASVWIESQERVLPLDWREDSWENEDAKVLSQRHQLQGFILRFKGTMLQLKRIEKELLFSYDPSRRGPTLGGGFKEEQQLHFELALKSEKLTLLSLVSDDILKTEDIFLNSTISEELRRENSYRLMSVTQPLKENPRVEMGLKMDWTDLYLTQLRS